VNSLSIIIGIVRSRLGTTALAHLARAILASIGRAWSLLWFQPSETSPLELARIGIGGAMLYHYAMATPYLFEFWGDDGWMPRAIALQYRANPWMQSAFFYFTAPWQWYTFHAAFLVCCLAFMLGWRTAVVKWFVLIGQISYDYRNLVVPYGVDIVLACLLYILCFAPIGKAMSLDRLRALRTARRDNPAATLPPYASPWAGACTRLMQIQMAVIFLYSGLSKRGDDWWNGDALWYVMSTNEFYHPFFVDLLARHYWMVNAATYATILIEVAYPFLIWQRSTRPYLLAAALFLHLQFFTLLGLYYFSFVMMMGHMSFVRPEWLQGLGAWWRHQLATAQLGRLSLMRPGRLALLARARVKS
jgi:vitamin K-dependent gamma-carboxylase-like protein